MMFMDSAFWLVSSVDDLMREHSTVALLSLWGIAMLSFHQDAKLKTGFGILSQTLAVVSLIAVAVFGFARGEWWNFLIVAAMAWVHVQFTRRWSARPGAWW